MNIAKLKYFYLILLNLVTGISIAHAQDLNITGDTIYVNAEAEVMVRFPTLPTFWNTVPSDAPYSLKTAGTGFTIIAKAEKTKTAPLFVNEGGRTHKFFLVFKKKIDYNNFAELDYDYSTTKKLEQHLKEKARTEVAEAETPAVSKKENKKSKKEKIEENTTVSYYALLEAGDNDIKQKDYAAAKQNFEKAQKLRPNDQIPKQRLEEIRLRIADEGKNAEQEKNKQYVDLLNTAKAGLNANKYPQAQEAYKKALEIKPGDIYATHQLEKIEKLLADAKDKDEKDRLNELYKGFISTGEKAFKKNNLVEARAAYEQALVIKQNDAAAITKIKIIDEREKVEKSKTEQESNYNNSIASADKLFKAGDYDAAKAAYENALSITKNKWPQDQLKKINKLQAELVARENEEKEKKLKQAEAEIKNNERLKTETAYNDAIKAADKYFAAKDYTNATIAYNKALSIDIKPWPGEQLKTIQKLKEQEEADKKKIIAQLETDKQAKERKKKEDKERQAKEKEYKAVIQDADKLFKKKDYAAAKDAYIKATTLSSENWPHEQLAAINKIAEEQRAKEIADKIRQAKEAETEAQFNNVIAKANAEFEKGNYLKARKLYTDAAVIKPADNLPKQKIDLIQTTLDELAAAEKAKKESLVREAELKKKYILVMSKAKSYYLKDDLVNAKAAYTQAADLKPGEAEPKAQLKAIQDKLEALAKANAVNDIYEQKISKADSLLISKQYTASMASYKEALAIKPNEYYPKTQLNYLTGEIKNQQKEKEDRAKLEAYKKEEELEQKYRDALKRANQAVTDKNYVVAKAAYTEVLNLKPDNEYAKQRLEIVVYQMEKETIAKNKKVDEKKAEIINPVSTEKKEIKIKEKIIVDSALMKSSPVPYTAAELKEKYPNIDFASLPPEQPFNEEAVNTLDNSSTFKDIILENARLNLSATENKIKLTCQGINFEGANIYLKLLIQNNSNTDFLTGAMMLTWTKRSGNRIKLYPVFLYPAFLPIITPGKEAYVIYVCRSYFINDSEKLDFELNDRLNKIKLGITIPGNKFNEEEGRY